MKEYCFTVDCELRTHTVSWVTREFKYLVGKQCPEGTEFIQAVGLWDNFTVAGGQNTEAWTTKSRVQLLKSCDNLLERVKQDREYINYDYQCGFSAEGKTRHSGMGFGVQLPGGGAIIWLHPGQIYLERRKRGPDGKFSVLDTVDLRRSGPIQTENKGLLKIYKRSNPIDWELKLPSLIDFLRDCSCESVRVRHHYPPKVHDKKSPG